MDDRPFWILYQHLFAGSKRKAEFLKESVNSQRFNELWENLFRYNQ